ncbi:alpha-2-macroglobulin-like protein [Labeo rohita]|uniref:Alpha-2-macroglobulin-like protein n=2 Tax=Labeonini TaxID=2743697 RepID=A0A498MVS1_LABRO|nr:alpha-2-macroglobulin-like protein [Labeo rohita]
MFNWEWQAQRSFMVTFPAVIESQSEAKLCASLLKPNESLVMNIYLLDGDQSTLLLQEKAEEEFHRCFNFQTPQVEAESVQTMKVELQGENFKMTEKRKVMFRRYNPLTFIQTDKPIYIPGQTVLPKFEITMKAPKEISFGDSDMNMEMSEMGCASFSWDISVFLNSTNERVLKEHLTVKVNVIEEGTENTMGKSEIISLTYESGKATFTELPKIYEHGSVIQGKIKLANVHGAPLQNKEVYVLEGKRRSSKLLLNLTTDSDGLAEFSLNTSSLSKSDINLMASAYPEFQHQSFTTPYFSTEEKTIQLLRPATPYTPTLSELIIENIEQPLKCDAEFTMTIKYYFVGETVEDFKTDIVYIVLSRGVIVHHGYEKVEVKSSDGAANGSVSFKLSVVSDLAPAVQILAYCVLPSENVVAGNRDFTTEKCFKNKIGTSYFCHYRFLCSFLLLKQFLIFNLLPVRSVSGYPYNAEDTPECLEVRPRRAVSLDRIYDSLKPLEVYTAFYYTVLHNRDSGSAQVPVTVPDTITSWETEAFCLSSKGLGLAPPAQLTVFQPFFLELSLPYSIIRGEIFELKATVFNYLSKCIMVKVTPAPSSDYTLKASSDDQYSSCLCANGRKTFKWILTPSVLGVLNITVSAEAEASQTLCDNEIVSVPERGRIDTVTRSLLVQAEGTEKTETYSWLLCPKGDSLSEEVDLTLPKDVIEGSARSSVSVIGDILGRALSNLHGLLQMPYGCGEQNMAILSPNIYILQYLENTEQLTSAIRERATGFLKNGYQRQLNYRHNSGAYSTFGHGDENTWLTAFVLRSFGKAQKYIFIDPQIIQSAKEWLIRRRDSDGCFIQQGKLFNNRMKGGVNDNVTMTAYITASLLELETPVTDPVVTKGLSCLKSVIEDVKNTYTTALLTYTFSLARDTDTRQQLFKKLEDVAISDGSHLHWSQSGSAGDSDSLAVEISSYVLLAVLTTDSVTPADLGFANRIVSWLVKQQNAYGGFSSTQDTVVALQALSLYATKVFSSDGSSTVTVQSAGDTHHFDVNQDNKLLYQEKQLQNVPAKYSIEVKGSTCVSVQIAQFYNIPTPTEAKTLRIDAKIEGDCKKTFGQDLLLNFTVTYNGPQARSNMVIVDIKLLSGFTADTSLLELQRLSRTSLVERLDSKDDHVIVYLKEVQKNIPVNLQIKLKQVLPVKNLKPAVIKVYDYYQTSDQSEMEYSSHCE